MFKLDVNFAQQLVELINEVTQQNANIFGEGGVIIASTQKERIGNIHDGAKKILAGEVAEIAITEEMAKTMQGAKPGYNIGIDFGDGNLAAIGISGDPEVVKPIALITSHVIKLEYKREFFMSQLSVMASDINLSLQSSTAGLEELAATSDEHVANATTIHETMKEVKARMMNTSQIIHLLKTISKQANILGINAAIEASRLGNAGKGFQIVAQEIGKLAGTTAKSSKEIETIIVDIQNLVNEISSNLEKNVVATQEQYGVLQNLTKEQENIAAAVDSFNQSIVG
ncbi:sugar diacid recognition domain-containing protein [Clostridium formicaceticum]|uniref:Methyl-accepting chemotaxis protein YoaH n=1 Tax=Clostridium formicaceticum TaxID=1497 RepID=A0AAC9RNG0_9CLOT|nr:sugar diacid recognition domain-containing protein [Clostridium formicaceticum]AOY74558.1 hypothetical protein BJL90_00460 [Clostridium formicaceticum]ARE88914.1 Putative methyl-accepting chemotaxis protein YoaH [Clostridium formicaceticum]